MKIEELLLITGNDIPFPPLALTIHQPRIKEISLLGENDFFQVCNLLKFTKDFLPPNEDKNKLESFSNFEIILSIIKQRNPKMNKLRILLETFLSIIFPECEIQIGDTEVLLKNKNGIHSLNKDNFDEFKDTIMLMEGIQKKGETYSPNGSLSSKIADKLAAGRAKAAAAKGKKDDDESVIALYISILAVGEGKTFQQFNEYTLYQLLDEFKRFELKENYDVYIRAKMAGATGMKDVDYWMKNIHE